MDTTPLSKGDKASAIARMFDDGHEGAAYGAMIWMLNERDLPQWLKDVCIQIDDNTMKEAA